MNLNHESEIRTMAISNTFYRKERYSEPDYDTAVELSISEITEEFHVFQFLLGAFQVSLEVELSKWTTSYYYLLPEATYKQVRNKEKPDTSDSTKHLYATVQALNSGLEFDVARFDVEQAVIDEVLSAWDQTDKTQGIEFCVNPNRFAHLFDAIFETYFERIKLALLDDLELEVNPIE
ncbi:hypothetical protein ACUZ8Y_23060 [Aeromonas veronii]|uniref:hypothetical protein n=1 Tax=Aeromonas veronii TaxID=654 RepID=UPI00406BA410